MPTWRRRGSQPPPLEDDPADAPDPQAECVSPIATSGSPRGGGQYDHLGHGIHGRFQLDTPAGPRCRGRSRFIRRGISPVPGLYFVGFPWLNSRKSGIIYGVEEDARYIAGAIAEQLT